MTNERAERLRLEKENAELKAQLAQAGSGRIQTMNTETKITGREEAIAKLDEWKRQAESAEKERADLLDRLAKAEQQLKEAVWVISIVTRLNFAVALLLLFTGCRFPGVDQHEGHNYEPNPWHVPVDTNSTKL